MSTTCAPQLGTGDALLLCTFLAIAKSRHPHRRVSARAACYPTRAVVGSASFLPAARSQPRAARGAGVYLPRKAPALRSSVPSSSHSWAGESNNEPQGRRPAPELGRVGRGGDARSAPGHPPQRVSAEASRGHTSSGVFVRPTMRTGSGPEAVKTLRTVMAVAQTGDTHVGGTSRASGGRVIANLQS